MWAFIYIQWVSEDKKQGSQLIKEQKMLQKLLRLDSFPPWVIILYQPIWDSYFEILPLCTGNMNKCRFHIWCICSVQSSFSSITRNTRFAGIPGCWPKTALDQLGMCQNTFSYISFRLLLTLKIEYKHSLASLCSAGCKWDWMVLSMSPINRRFIAN